MRSFSALYKKMFRELLSPYGYQLHNSLFYREVNQEQCFFITAQKDSHAPKYTVYFGVLPYCMDMESELEELRDIPDMLEFELTNLIWKLAPSLFNSETAEVYYKSRLYADPNDEDSTFDSLQNVCSDIKRYILPYFHQFVDLQYYYAEENKIWNLADPVRYGLSLKLHQYEDALSCVEYRLSDCRRIMNNYVQTLNRLEVGNLDKKDRIILKRDPDYATCVQEWIHKCNEKIAAYEEIRNNLLDNNFSDLDKLVAETEKRSRLHLKKLLSIDS